MQNQMYLYAVLSVILYKTTLITENRIILDLCLNSFTTDRLNSKAGLGVKSMAKVRSGNDLSNIFTWKRCLQIVNIY